MSEETVITLPSAHGFADTLACLEAELARAGLRLFGKLDHGAAARDAGLTMPPSVVVAFGNPQLGTPQFLQHPTLAIDFPLKALVWEDANGRVSITYNTARYAFGLYTRFGADPVPAAVVDGLARALAGIVARAVA